MATATSGVDKEGFLNKRGDKLNKSFKKRWFVLTGTELKYYKTKEGASGKEQGKIELDGVAVEICPEANYKKKFVFEVTSPAQSRVFILEAESGSSAQEWMTAIRQAMLKIRREKAKSASAARKEEKEVEAEIDPSQAVAIDLTSQYAKKKDQTEDDKYDVYRQWLDESKDSNRGKKGTGGGQAIRKGLLADEDQPPQNSGGCCSSCVVQ